MICLLWAESADSDLEGSMLVWVALLSVSSPTEATPSNTSAPGRLSYQNLIVGRLNPKGLLNRLELRYRASLYEHESPVLETNFVGLKVQPSLSPVFSKLGIGLKVQPLSVLQLFALYEWIQYFGTFEYLQSFASAADDYSDTALESLAEAETNYSGHGHQVTLGALVQMKLGPIAARSNFKLFYSSFDLRGDDLVFYDITLDALLPNEGWAISNDADLLYLSDFGLTLGLRHTYSRAFFGPEHFGGIEPTADPNRANHRLGPLVAYQFYEDEGPARFNKPTVLLLLNWYLEHRNRAGQDVSRAFPYIVVGFACSGDL